MELIFYPYFYPILLCLRWFQCYILDTIMYILLGRTSCEGKADASSKGRWTFELSHSQNTKLILTQFYIPNIHTTTSFISSD